MAERQFDVTVVNLGNATRIARPSPKGKRSMCALCAHTSRCFGLEVVKSRKYSPHFLGEIQPYQRVTDLRYLS